MKSKKLKGKKSKWSDEADFRIRNRKWLRYSSNIARRILAAIEDTDNLSQKVLSEKVGVSIQYINKMLKGQQNLTLETIAKLSDAVGDELISFPPYKYSKKISKHSTETYVMHNTQFQTINISLNSSIFIGNSEVSVNSNEGYIVDARTLGMIANIASMHYLSKAIFDSSSDEKQDIVSIVS